MYCQPCGLSRSAIEAACSRVCASVTAVPKLSQLFQPMGGVAAHMRNRGTGTAIWALRAAVSASPVKARLMCFDTAEAYGETARSGSSI